MRKFIEAIDKNKPMPNITVLDAMVLLTQDWSTVSRDTIRNCFRMGGIGGKEQQSAIADEDDPFKILEEDFDASRQKDVELAPTEARAEAVIEADDGVMTSESAPLSA